MIDLGGYIEYLRHDKATRYSDSTNAAIQDERLKIADDLERMLSNAAQGVGDPVVTCGRCAIPYARIPKDGRCHMCGSPLAPAAANNEGRAADGVRREAAELAYLFLWQHGRTIRAELDHTPAREHPPGSTHDSAAIGADGNVEVVDGCLRSLIFEVIDNLNDCPVNEGWAHKMADALQAAMGGVNV